MVDFQSRDSRPTYGGEDDTEEDAEDAEEEADGATVEESEVEDAGADADDTVAGDDPGSATAEATEPPMPSDEEVPGASLVSGTGDDQAPAPSGGAHAPQTARTEAESAVEAPTEASIAVGVAVVTVGDDMTVEDDRAGESAMELLDATGYDVATREVIAARYDNVQQTLGGLAVRDDVDAVVTLGGDGVGPDDVTVDAARALFDKELPGFGELFRARASESIGTRVLHTRTCGGIVDGLPVFCLPGSSEAAALGLEEIVLPELDDLVDALRD